MNDPRFSRPASLALAGALAAGLSGTPDPAHGARPRFEPVPVGRWTSAPLRHLAGVVLDAPIDSVWALVSDPRRLPEYSGLLRVDLTLPPGGAPHGAGARWRCHFPDGATTDEVTVYSQAPYSWAATGADEPYKSAGDLSVVVLEPNGQSRTILTWRQYYDPGRLGPEIADSYEKGILEIARSLAARFGGYVVLSRAEEPGAAGR